MPYSLKAIFKAGLCLIGTVGIVFTTNMPMSIGSMVALVVSCVFVAQGLDA